MNMRFRNRADAGRRLAEALAGRIESPAVVAGIPRGGVLVAAPVAERLQAPLTVVYARKLTTPSWPELAFGAVDEDGYALIDARTVKAIGLSREEVDAARDRVSREIDARRSRYGVAPLSAWLPGRSVVLVDDGLATGLTMQAGLELARRHGARDVTIATPCAPADAATRIGEGADLFVSLVVDPEFRAVGQWYEDFRPVTDDEVIEALKVAARRGSAKPALAAG
jgi:putative phosphoribosyl transferase